MDSLDLGGKAGRAERFAGVEDLFACSQGEIELSGTIGVESEPGPLAEIVRDPGPRLRCRGREERHFVSREASGAPQSAGLLRLANYGLIVTATPLEMLF